VDTSAAAGEGTWEQPARRLAQQLLRELRAARAARLRRHARAAVSGEDDLALLADEVALLDAWILRLAVPLQRLRDRGAGADPSAGRARPGSSIQIRWDDGAVETFVLRAPAEFGSEPHCISPDSALGHALLGKRPGDAIALLRLGGRRRARVMAVS
jgi:transcription elongation GreA/GreB family factor